MGQVTQPEVMDGSEVPWGGPGRVVGPSGRIWTGRETLGEVRDASRRSGRGRGTIGVVLDGRGTLGKVWDG